MSADEAVAMIPPRRSGVRGLREAASGCRACPLWRNATQTVFGGGRARAPIMLVGEQPGDQEDRRGRPFVGPAGGILDKALAEAGIDRSLTYQTNAVKHFKFKPRGKRRIHQRPSTLEINACKPNRGKALTAEFAPAVVATFHPSSVLRAPNEDRDEPFAALVDDLRALRAAA